MRRVLLCLSILVNFSGCSKQEEFPDYGPEEQKIYEEFDGVYHGKFLMLNSRRTRIKPGSVLWIKGNQFYVKIIMKRGLRKLRYQQYIHKGSRCPDEDDDHNGDNVIDFAEAIDASGEILIPLDGFVEKQKKGSEWFPSTDNSGSYYYSRSASLNKMMKNLFEGDERAEDRPGKLSPGEGLDLYRRTLILYGSKKDPLLPVACATLELQTN